MIENFKFSSKKITFSTIFFKKWSIFLFFCKILILAAYFGENVLS